MKESIDVRLENLERELGWLTERPGRMILCQEFV
jgi:hypothetical protein